VKTAVILLGAGGLLGFAALALDSWRGATGDDLDLLGMRGDALGIGADLGAIVLATIGVGLLLRRLGMSERLWRRILAGVGGALVVGVAVIGVGAIGFRLVWSASALTDLGTRAPGHHLVVEEHSFLNTVGVVYDQQGLLLHRLTTFVSGGPTPPFASGAFTQSSTGDAVHLSWNVDRGQGRHSTGTVTVKLG
jgi:hypothetical protein